MATLEGAPEHCPGPESEGAGKGSACQGCPNQTLCSSGAVSSMNDGVEKVADRLTNVKNKIAVLSGKGGVGKSTFTCLLARVLASEEYSKNVGVVDIDICGPSIPRLFGVQNGIVHQSGSGWCPVYADENLAVMSIGFLLKDTDEAVVWRGNRKTNMIQQFLTEVDWGSEPLDYLILDTPPGTSDEHISSATLFSSAGLKAVIVSTPQEMALLDVRKEIDFCKRVKIPIIGVVENMAPFICPHCKVESEIFPADSGGVEGMCKEMGVEFLGRVPLDYSLTRACDEGLESLPEDLPSIKPVRSVVNKIMESLGESPPS